MDIEIKSWLYDIVKAISEIESFIFEGVQILLIIKKT
jgi:hypothetical protein